MCPAAPSAASEADGASQPQLPLLSKYYTRETGAPGTTVGTQKDAAALGNSMEGLQKNVK